MDFRLLSPNSRAAAAQQRRSRADSAAIEYFRCIHHKKNGWVRPADIKMLLANVLNVKISDYEFLVLMSTPLYVALFGRSGTKRSSLNQLRIKMEKSNKSSISISKTTDRKQASNRNGSGGNTVKARKAHTILKKCILSSCRKEWYTRPLSRHLEGKYSKPIPPKAFAKIRNDLDYDYDGHVATSLRWGAAAGSSPSITERRGRTGYGRKVYKVRDLSGGGAKGVMDWDTVGVKRKADQANVHIADTMRLHFGSITKAFRAVDADKNSGLSPRELRCMLTRMGVEVSDSEFNRFLDKYADVLHDGKIGFQAFASKFGGTKNNSLRGMGYNKQKSRYPYSHRSCRFSADQALQLLSQKMKSHFRNVTQAFRSADKNHDGKLTWMELREVLQHWQIMMSDSEYMRLVQKVIGSFGAGQRTSCITLEQFKKSVLGMAVAAGNDPGLFARHRENMTMHKNRDKKRAAKADTDKTSLPGLGEDKLNARGQRMPPKLKSKSKTINPTNSREPNVSLPII